MCEPAGGNAYFETSADGQPTMYVAPGDVIEVPTGATAGRGQKAIKRTSAC